MLGLLGMFCARQGLWWSLRVPSSSAYSVILYSFRFWFIQSHCHHATHATQWLCRRAGAAERLESPSVSLTLREAGRWVWEPTACVESEWRGCIAPFSPKFLQLFLRTGEVVKLGLLLLSVSWHKGWVQRVSWEGVQIKPNSALQPVFGLRDAW